MEPASTGPQVQFENALRIHRSNQMNTLESRTIEISYDEPALSLAETDVMSGQPGLGLRRVRKIRVIRSDAVATYEEDLGPSIAFIAGSFYLAGGVVVKKNGEVTPLPENIPHEQVHRIQALHTVGELMDIAAILRSESEFVLQIEPNDLIDGYNRIVELKQTEARRKRKL